MMSVQVFMLALVFLGTLNSSLQVCKYNKAGDILPGQSGCYNLQPVFSWIKRCIISIFIVFWIAFVPLFVQGECGDSGLDCLGGRSSGEGRG
jgi:1,3-beta-glucan synthase